MSLRVFVTGAAGYVGNAIAHRFAQSGYEVHGLTRRQDRVESLRAQGIKPLVGDLDQPESFLSDLKNCDAVVHASFQAGPGAPRHDQNVLENLKAGVVDGRVRHVLYTSSVWVHGDTGERVEDESADPHPAETVAWRPAHEEVALDLVENEVHVAVMRPALVYGGTGGILGGWFREAREKKVVTYPGDGSQHWNMVHRDDVAEGYRLALEHARGGQRFILADESHFTVRELAEAVARASGVEAQPWDREQVVAQLGLSGAAQLLDQRVTAARARRVLGWVPRHTHFVAEAASLRGDWLAGEQTIHA
jgi:nucleoside-diphosphate-sugar epimerase